MIKYLVMDVDGSLTDGKIYMGPNGEVMKGFSVKDGYVFNYILKPNNIKPVIITARNSAIVEHRCKELGIQDIYQGKFDKLETLKEVAENCFEECAYFGDDVLDLNCMIPIKEAGGIIGCPSDAVREVKEISDYICENKSGEGALREFVEWFVTPRVAEEELYNRIQDAIQYMQKLDVKDIPIGKKMEIDDNFYYMVQNYDTKPANKCKLESHREYVDIQMIISGEEAMDIVDISRLTVKEAYDVDKDVVFWNIPQRMVRTILRDGDCIVLYPEHAHRGAVTNGKKKNIMKIVGKIRIHTSNVDVV